MAMVKLHHNLSAAAYPAAKWGSNRTYLMGPVARIK